MQMETYDWKKAVYRDCRKVMLPALAFGVARDVTSNLLAVYMAVTLGHFADAVFSLDREAGLVNVGELVLCLLAALVIVPALGLASELLHFSSSLKHDRFVLARYLDKTYLEGTGFTAGEAQYRLEQDPIDLRCSWLEIATKCVLLALLLPFLIYRAVSISAPYAFLAVLISGLKFCVPVAVRKLEARYDRQEREYRTRMRAQEAEMTRNPCAAKLYGLFGAFLERFGQSFQSYYQNTLRGSTACSVTAGSILSFLDTFCLLLLMFTGAVLMTKGAITPGDVVAMTAFFPIWNSLIGYMGNILRQKPILDNQAERVAVLYKGAEDCSGQETGTVTEITAENLSFSYGDKKAIDGLDFCIRQGEKVAICGRNGSGKSTLVKILGGVLREYQGSLMLGGRECNNVSLESWRRQLAFVEQDPHLFTGTIRQNIHLGNLNADSGKVTEVMDELEIGYLADREISQSRDTLSGGEKQRVSLARALLKDTPFLVFDEPGNNLDEKTVKWLCSYIAKSSKTIIYISHDDDFIQVADKKIIL